MKPSEYRYNKSVILLKLASAMMALALVGCNSGSGEKYEKTEPIYPATPYRVCSSRELIELPKENINLLYVSDDWEYGGNIYFYIYGPVRGFGPARIETSTLPQAATLMNIAMKAFDNCNEISSCFAKSESDLVDFERTSRLCASTSSVVAHYISDTHEAIQRDGRDPNDLDGSKKPDPSPYCEDPKYEGTKKHIEIVLTQGIEYLETMTDQSQKDSFKKELKTLCGHYRKVDYCGRNKAAVYEVCEKAFGKAGADQK